MLRLVGILVKSAHRHRTRKGCTSSVSACLPTNGRAAPLGESITAVRRDKTSGSSSPPVDVLVLECFITSSSSPAGPNWLALEERGEGMQRLDMLADRLQNHQHRHGEEQARQSP